MKRFDWAGLKLVGSDRIFSIRTCLDDSIMDFILGASFRLVLGQWSPQQNRNLFLLGWTGSKPADDKVFSI